MVQSRRKTRKQKQKQKQQRGGNADLQEAAKTGNVAQFAELLATPGIDVNYVGKYGETPLCTAADNGKTEIVKLLLEDPLKRVDVNKADTSGWTPLYAAAEHGHPAIVKLLLEDPLKRADVNKENDLGLTPLIAAANGRTEIVKLLLEKRVDVNKASNSGWTPLYLAASWGKTEIVKLLLEDPEKRVDVNKAHNFNGYTPLRAAAERGHTAIVKLLLEDPRTVVDQKTKDALREGKFKPEIAELFAPPVPLPLRNIPRNATNAIMLDEINEGNVMVNFQGESGFGRYYKKSSYDQMPSPKTNPYTKNPIAPTNVVKYKARLVGGRKTRRGNRSGRKTRRVRSRR